MNHQPLDKDDAVALYPNPASNLLNVKVNANMKGYTFQIFDATGRILKNSVIQSPVFSLNIKNVATGTYFYRLLDGRDQSVQDGKFNVTK